MKQQSGHLSPLFDTPFSGVRILPITQATSATFTDLYFSLTFLFFIRSGSKRVTCPRNGEVVGESGDLMIVPPGSVITLENRPILNAHYRADGVCFANELVDQVFAEPTRQTAPGIQVLHAEPHRPQHILSLIRETLERHDLPAEIRRHRLLEPLIWLRENGISLPSRGDDPPWSAVRRLIDNDVSREWRITEVAKHFGMSEATFRRWLAKSGPGFAQIVLHTRLERALTLLQTTVSPVSEIALECGFKTPSHFSDAFRKRFGIKPKMIRTSEE